TLNLVITTRRYNELYEMHINLSREIEMELITNNRYNVLNNDPVKFATTINNPISINSKGQKPKNAKNNNKKNINNTSKINYNETLNVQRDKITNLEANRNVISCENESSNKQMNEIIQDSDNNCENDNLPLSATRYNDEDLTRILL
ncbi:11780_t:CDS:2, partial [Racocetra fulgida]